MSSISLKRSFLDFCSKKRLEKNPKQLEIIDLLSDFFKQKKTLISASSIEKKIKKDKMEKMKKSNLIGEILAKRAKEKNISEVYFDRGEYKYHGRIKAFAETLRKNGLKF